MTWLQTLTVSILGGFTSLSLKWLFDLGRHKLTIRGQKDIFVHKTQFEKEFNAYAEIWINIPDLTSHMMSFDDITTLNRIERREKELPKLFEQTSKLISVNEPFLHPSVLASCRLFFSQITEFGRLNRKLDSIEKQIDKNATKNSGDITDSDDKKWNDLYDQWRNSLDGIIERKEDIKSSIRKRIWNTK